MDLLIKQLINLNQNRLYIIGSNQIGTIVSLPALLNKETLSYQSVFLIDDEGSDIIDGGDYLCVTYRGSYEKSAYWGQQLTQYAHTHNFTIHGNLLEILWIDIHTTSNESEYITQLQLPIK